LNPDPPPSFASIAQAIGNPQLEATLVALSEWIETETHNAGFVPKRSEVRADLKKLKAKTKEFEIALNRVSKQRLLELPVSDHDALFLAERAIEAISKLCEDTVSSIPIKGGVTKKPGRVTCAMIVIKAWTIARGRFNWLLVNLATAFLASSVLGLFEGQLEKMVALAVLAPIVASQGGNAATQTMTVAVRALATRELGSNNALRVILREALVGLVNGLAFAIITGVAAVAWFKIPGLGVVIGLAIICNLIAGALGGILVPMVLERVRADPAVASGTFVTTITDVVGFFSFLGIATLWFGLK